MFVQRYVYSIRTIDMCIVQIEFSMSTSCFACCEHVGIAANKNRCRSTVSLKSSGNEGVNLDTRNQETLCGIQPLMA